jgi:hypothetical protein
MSLIELTLDGSTFPVPTIPLITNCRTFEANPSLLTEPYRVRSPVNPDSLRLFVDTIKCFGSCAEIPAESVSDVSLLCEEFGFARLSEKIRNADSMRDEVEALKRLILDQQRQIESQQELIAQLTSRKAESPESPSSPGPECAPEPPQPLSASLSARRFVPAWRSPLNGIIAHLTRRFGGNVFDRNVINVTSSGPANYYLCCTEKNVCDFDCDSYFCSTCNLRSTVIPHTPNHWICYDFGARRVALTHYALRSYAGRGPNGPHPRCWAVEASDDGQDWAKVDRRERNSEMNDRNVTRLFKVETREPRRFIRLVNIGRNHYGDDRLVISAWEVFGSLVEPTESETE